MHPEEKGSIGTRVIIILGFALMVLALARFLMTGLSGSALPVLAGVPTFELTDQNGEMYGSKELQGRVWAATFIYSTCPGPCPRVVQKTRELDAALGHDPRFTLVSISVDPDVDSPEALAEYGQAHGVDPVRWKLLTGPSDQIFDLVRNGFLLGVSQRDEEAVPSADGPVVHSVRLAVVDTDMNIRGYYDTNDPAAMRRAAADIRRLLAESS